MLRFSDGVSPSRGGPGLSNTLTVRGTTELFSNKDTASLTIVTVPLRSGRFIRGDVNGDGWINISDPIWLLNYLFRGGGEPPCFDAADTNDDGRVGLTDAIFLGVYLWPNLSVDVPFDSMRPLAPFPACGEDPSDLEIPAGDGVGCEESNVCP